VRLNPVFIVILFSPFGFFVQSTKNVAGESGWKDPLDKRGEVHASERKLTTMSPASSTMYLTSWPIE
jgi:hypothetical protein